MELERHMKDNSPASNGDTHACNSTFEASLAALEAAVHELEDGQLGLSDALARYEDSVKHLKHCYQLLEAAEQKIELLTGVADDGTPLSQPFMASETSEASIGRKRRPRSKPASTPGGTDSGDIDGSADGT
jgi:exodeoxyribonuclease VII small subunit